MKLLSLCICALILAWGEIPAAEAGGPEGAEWQLVEVGGTPVSEFPGERHPYIALDPAKKKAAGLAGCNRFSTSYELDGPSLRFGPVVSTRRACPEPLNRVETAFLAALERTGAWNITNSELLFMDGGDVLARFRAMHPLKEPDLESMTFLSSWFSSGKVVLSRGEYREALSPGSAEQIVVRLTGEKAFGSLNGRDAGVAVLSVSTGGTGTFYNLALLFREEDGWVNSDSRLLGDRVKVHSVVIRDGGIVVDMTVHGPRDPACCPTLREQRRFGVQGTSLVTERRNDEFLEKERK
ncbi:MAG: META domain-containing protein [Acidobacteriota bacterium]